MTGTRLLAALALVGLATAVLPPGLAWLVNQRRIGRAAEDVSELAEGLRKADRPLPSPQVVGVLSGPGRMPVTDSTAAVPWGTAPRGSLTAALGPRLRVTTDPWGNCYLVNLGASAGDRPATVWVLSAGPNGVVDTPFIAPLDAPAGDDVARRIR